MVTHEEVDEFFRRLLAGVVQTERKELAQAERKQHSPDQSKQLLTAFNRISDPRLRQELLILIEIVSQMPDLLQNKRERWVQAALAQVH